MIVRIRGSYCVLVWYYNVGWEGKGWDWVMSMGYCGGNVYCFFMVVIWVDEGYEIILERMIKCIVGG